MDIIFNNKDFEIELREQLNVFDRLITDDDVKNVTSLDLTNFTFSSEDIDTLLLFKNLKNLSIEMEYIGYDFWKHFPSLESLFWIVWGDTIDLSIFSSLTNLNSLIISGGDFSSIPIENLDSLINLQKLTSLSFIEFGTFDATAFSKMKQLKSLEICYSNSIKNISVIGEMTQLEKLSLVSMPLESLDFLDSLPSNLELELCGIELPSEKAINVKNLMRFENRDIDEIIITKPYYHYVDLSLLNNT